MKAFFRRNPILKDALGIALILLILSWLNPFAVASNADRASAALFYWVVAPHYPEPFDKPERATPFDDKTGIAVIVINDESLANIDMHAHGRNPIPWPPPFSVHTKVVEKIFESALPKALFIDFGFFDDRDPQATKVFSEALAKHAVPNEEFKPCLGDRPRQSGAYISACTGWPDAAPIFLPRANANAPEHLQVLAPLKNAVTALVSTKYIGEDPETFNQYDLFDCETFSPSAGLAMYLSSGASPSYRAADCDAKMEPPRLSIFWSDWGDKDHGRGSFACEGMPRHWLYRLWRIAEIWAADIFPLIDMPERFQTCPPHLSVSAHEFLADDTGMMAAVLHDRFVFYGGNFTMADDLIRPPTHRAIPGVYAHAMVLDNLLQGRAKFLRSGWSEFSNLLLTGLAILFASLCSALTWRLVEWVDSVSDGTGILTASSHRREIASPYDRLIRWLSTYRRRIGKGILIFILALMGLIVCFSGVSGLAAVGFFWLDLPPINFIGIFAFIGFHGLLRGLANLLEAIF